MLPVTLKCLAVLVLPLCPLRVFSKYSSFLEQSQKTCMIKHFEAVKLLRRVSVREHSVYMCPVMDFQRVQRVFSCLWPYVPWDIIFI